MSVTLTAEQFAALIANVNVAPKKKTKSLLKDCGNAIDIEQFVEHLEYLKVHKLMTMDLCEFVCQTIKMNIERLEDDEMPFICSDAKRRTFYYKTNGEWKKGNDFIRIIFNRIWKRASQDICNKYNIIQDDENDDDDDETIERKFENSKHYEKQVILKSLCYADKYSSEKLLEKILNKLGRTLKNNDFDVER